MLARRDLSALSSLGDDSIESRVLSCDITELARETVQLAEECVLFCGTRVIVGLARETARVQELEAECEGASVRCRESENLGPGLTEQGFFEVGGAGGEEVGVDAESVHALAFADGVGKDVGAEAVRGVSGFARLGEVVLTYSTVWSSVTRILGLF